MLTISFLFLGVWLAQLHEERRLLSMSPVIRPFLPECACQAFGRIANSRRCAGFWAAVDTNRNVGIFLAPYPPCHLVAKVVAAGVAR
jgi:hypothetical protein